MAEWHAKPSGGYALGSLEANENLEVIYGFLYDRGWTLEAVAGLCGNFVSESGLNPWRWQSDSVSLTDRLKGYGLPQFTPAYGYIQDYGVGIEGFAPNLSTSGIQGGNPSDGGAQLICIDEDRAHKFFNRSRYCSYADISSVYPMSEFKETTDLWLATVGWLFHYEFPAATSRTYDAAMGRYNNALSVYEYLGGVTPVPPHKRNRYGGIDWELRRRLVKPF